MKYGFIRAAAVTPEIRVADCVYNAAQITAALRKAAAGGARLAVLPELCLTGYTCGDLFGQSVLLDGALDALRTLLARTADLPLIAAVGLPIAFGNRLYNCAAVFCAGRLLGLVPKRNLPNYGEFYELRRFAPAFDGIRSYPFLGGEVPFGTELLFRCRELSDLTLAVEICEDLWVPCPPSIRHAAAGATVIANLSAGNETVGKADYRRSLVAGQSARLVCGYVYSGAGEGESTTDLVFSGHRLIAENGALLVESALFQSGCISSEIDVERLAGERRRLNTYSSGGAEGYVTLPFSLPAAETPLTRRIPRTPFVPDAPGEREQRCRDILLMQEKGLRKRMEHTGCRRAVIGVSGGLDSTLALLVAARALEGRRQDVLAVTMPCFGTTSRTRENAVRLSKLLGATLREIDLTPAVERHFQDIGQDPGVHDVTYENAQARERTQVLMDLANQTGGLVVGTGDLSELALGWATYNGDHMSMYGVNASVPKTLVRYLVETAAGEAGGGLREVLLDILNTPVSPELLPAAEGQRTEELVGPYLLHDFFLYYAVRFGFSPRKIFHLAEYAFRGEYAAGEILRWERMFYRRFFAQQFKRSCLPDGPKVGSVALSPRGDWRMPSDAETALWLAELDALG